MPILGFGTVEIATQCPPGALNTKAVIRLENVIHVPTMMCNTIGRSFTDSSKIGAVDYSKSIPAIKPISSPHNDLSDAVAYFDSDQYQYRLVMNEAPTGHQLGPYVLPKKNTLVGLGFVWPAEEIWKVFGTTARGLPWAWVFVD